MFQQQSRPDKQPNAGRAKRYTDEHMTALCEAQDANPALTIQQLREIVYTHTNLEGKSLEKEFSGYNALLMHA